MTTLLFAMIYKYIPRERLAWSDVWTGGSGHALLFTIGKFLIVSTLAKVRSIGVRATVHS